MEIFLGVIVCIVIASAIFMAVEIRKAPVGKEIPGVGLVTKPRKGGGG